jgi:hypothetical protein
MSWQKCPICDGIGVVEVAKGVQPLKCDVCNGQKIIGEDGKPPPHNLVWDGKVPDLSADELIRPMSPFDEISDEEVQYWATPHYDELQAKKQAQQQRIKEEINLKGERHG